MSNENAQTLKKVVHRMREAADLLQVYTAKTAATKATKIASTAAMEASKTATLATELSVLAAKAATLAAAAAANVARLANSTEDAFHRTDDAAAAELPDQAIKWSMEATRLAQAAVSATEAAAKALRAYEDTTEQSN